MTVENTPRNGVLVSMLLPVELDKREPWTGLRQAAKEQRQAALDKLARKNRRRENKMLRRMAEIYDNANKQGVFT